MFASIKRNNMDIKLKKRILKNGSTSYYIEYYFGCYKSGDVFKTKRKYKSLGIILVPDELKENKKKLKLVEDTFAIEKVKFLSNKTSINSLNASKVLLSDYFSEYINYRSEIKSKGVLNSSFKQFLNFEQRSSKIIKLSDVDFEFCDSFYRFLSEKTRSKELSINSINSYYNVFSRVLNWGVQNNKLNSNPSLNVKKIKGRTIEKSHLSDSDLQQLLSNKPDNIYFKSFLFSCFTGLRFVDVKKLKFNNLNYDNELGQYFLSFVQSKTGEPVKVLLNEDSLSLIDTAYINQEIPVFPFLTYSHYNNGKLKNWLYTYNITKKITYHSSRYTMIYRLSIQDVPIYHIQKIVGHTSINTTNRYLNNINTGHFGSIKLLPKLSA